MRIRVSLSCVQTPLSERIRKQVWQVYKRTYHVQTHQPQCAFDQRGWFSWYQSIHSISCAMYASLGWTWIETHFFFVFFLSQTDELAWKASAWQVQVKDGQTIAWESGSCWHLKRRARPSGPPVSWERVIIIARHRAYHAHWLTCRRLNWLLGGTIDV